MSVQQRKTIQDRLADARGRYRRVTATEAFEAIHRGAHLIDTRDTAQRLCDGDIPGALIIDRTVLEWRVDPASGATHPALGNLDAHMILICNEGYSSTLAVASLLDLGASRVTDVIGGFQAWLAAGLAVVQPPMESNRGNAAETDPKVPRPSTAEGRGRRTSSGSSWGTGR